MDPPVYDTLILSDVHLGADTSRAREATCVLKENRFRRLILLGDIFADLNFRRLTKEHWSFSATFASSLIPNATWRWCGSRAITIRVSPTSCPIWLECACIRSTHGNTPACVTWPFTAINLTASWPIIFG